MSIPHPQTVSTVLQPQTASSAGSSVPPACCCYSTPRRSNGVLIGFRGRHCHIDHGNPTTATTLHHSAFKQAGRHAPPPSVLGLCPAQQAHVAMLKGITPPESSGRAVGLKRRVPLTHTNMGWCVHPRLTAYTASYTSEHPTLTLPPSTLACAGAACSGQTSTV